MFGVSGGELLVVGLVALLVLGPGKLPEAARTAGRLYSQLQRLMAEARATLKAEIDLAEAAQPRPAPAPPPSASPAVPEPAPPPAEAAPPPDQETASLPEETALALDKAPSTPDEDQAPRA